MKKLNSTMWLLLSILLVGAVSSCSKSSELNQYLRNDAAVVISCSPKTFLENSDCKVSKDGIELSDALSDLVNGAFGSRDRKMLNKILSIPGIDYDKAVLSVGSNMQGIFLVGLTDPDAFVKYAEDLDLDPVKEKGTTVLLQERGLSVFVRDNVLSLFASMSGRFDVEDLEDYLSDAADNKLASWQTDVLDEGNFINGFVSMEGVTALSKMLGQPISFDILSQLGFDKEYEALENGYVRFHSELAGTAIKLEGEMCSADGDAIDMSKSIPEVNTKLLKYTSSDDIFVAMASMPKNMDWAKLFKSMMSMMGMGYLSASDAQALNTVADVLDNIDGTIMVAAGPKNVKMIDEMEGWSGVIAVEMKAGKAEQYLSDIKRLMDEQIANANAEAEMDMFEPDEYMPSCTLENGLLTITMPDYGTICAKADGNVFVAAIGNVSEKGGCTVKADVFDDARGGFAMNLPKVNAFSGILTLPFGISGYYVSDGKKVEMKLEETDVKGNFFANIFKFFAGNIN